MDETRTPQEPQNSFLATAGQSTTVVRPTPVGIRAVAGLVAAIGLCYAAGITFFIGAIVTTGCLMECSDPDPRAGTLILLGSVALLVLALAATWWGLFNRHWRTVWKVLAILGALLTVAVIAFVGSGV